MDPPLRWRVRKQKSGAGRETVCRSHMILGVRRNKTSVRMSEDWIRLPFLLLLKTRELRGSYSCKTLLPVETKSNKPKQEDRFRLTRIYIPYIVVELLC